MLLSVVDTVDTVDSVDIVDIVDTVDTIDMTLQLRTILRGGGGVEGAGGVTEGRGAAHGHRDHALAAGAGVLDTV